MGSSPKGCKESDTTEHARAHAREHIHTHTLTHSLTHTPEKTMPWID